MRAAVYVRQSFDRRGEALAVGRQETECRELADRNGWEVARVYCDNDKSATNGGKRPEWSRLLADLKAGQYDTLICWHTDRLYRRLRDLVDLLDIAEKRSLRIVAVQAGELDLSTASGRMVASMLGNVASYETSHKSERQRSANRAAAARGVIRWGRRPYGYTLEDGRIVVVPGERAVILDAAARVLRGVSTGSIVDDLNKRNVPTSTGSRWGVTALRRVLTNPRTSGRAVSNGEDFGRGDWPAILDQDTADRLAALFSTPGRRTAPQSMTVKHLLSGLAVCGKCGGRMYATATSSGPLVYRCRQLHLARNLAAVDEVVEQTVIGRLAQPDAIDLLAPDVDLDALRTKVVELRDRRDGLAALLADGLLTANSVREQASRLTDSIGELERAIMAATGDGPLATMLGADDVATHWAGLPLLAKRTIIDTLMTVRILPAGKGKRFDADDIDTEWRSS